MSLETASDTTTNRELLENTTVEIGNAAQFNISGQHSLLPRMTVDAGGLLDAASLYLPGTNSTLPSTDQYPSAELLPTHDLTEEDRRLAAALVAVQFVQQQKHQQQLLINDNANQDAISTLPGIAQLTGSIKTTMSGISESQPLIISAIDRPAMAAMVSSYIQAVDADANSVLYTNSNNNVQTTTESSLGAPLPVYKEINLSQSPRRKKHGSVSSANSTGSHIHNNQSPNFKQRNNISPVVKLEEFDIKSEEEGVCEGSDEGVLDSDYDDRIGNRSSKKSLPHKKRISRKLKHQKKSSSSTKNIHAKCYKCYKCGEQFTSQSDFAAHRNSHNVISDVTFCCQICSEVSVTQFSFFEHLKQHYEPNKTENTRQNNKITSLKGIELVNKEQMMNENQIVVTLPPAVYACNECGRTFRRQKTYETHVRDVHSKLEIEEFSEPEDLMDGIRVVVEAQEQSTEDDINSDPLEQHQMETNNTEVLQHAALGQLSSANLSSHSILTTDSKSWYREDELHATEADLQELEEQQLKGTTTLPYICNLCGALFQLKAYLIHHQTECYMINKDGLPADMQNLTTQQLQMEFGDVENGEEKRKRNRKKILKNTNGSLNCPSCGRGFNHRNSLVYHMRSHSGERPHQCEVCGKSFFATSALKVHMRLHSGDKPYKCEFCSRYFRQWGDLKYHCISIHSDQKQYQCEYCGKDFARKYSLIVHRRIHTGEKNYVCEFCNKTFRASSYLQNHRRIHTGEKPHTCSVCGKPFRVRSDMKRHLSTHSRDRHANKIIPPTTPTLDTDYTDSKGAVNTEKSNFPVREIIVQEDSGSATQENESVENKEEADEVAIPKTENVTTTLHYAQDPLAVRDGSNTLYVWPIYMN